MRCLPIKYIVNKDREGRRCARSGIATVPRLVKPGDRREDPPSPEEQRDGSRFDPKRSPRFSRSLARKGCAPSSYEFKWGASNVWKKMGLAAQGGFSGAPIRKRHNCASTCCRGRTHKGLNAMMKSHQARKRIKSKARPRQEALSKRPPASPGYRTMQEWGKGQCPRR